jgi:hypothetical protein
MAALLGFWIVALGNLLCLGPFRSAFLKYV